jgi:hypothetical protein
MYLGLDDHIPYIDKQGNSREARDLYRRVEGRECGADNAEKGGHRQGGYIIDYQVGEEGAGSSLETDHKVENEAEVRYLE